MYDSTLTIVAVETAVFRLPLHGQLQWGKHSVLNEVRHVLVRVRLSNGAEGVAEAPPRPTIYGETVTSVTSIIEQEIKPRLIGQPLTNVPAMHQIKNNHTAKGAVDMALHDALARSKGVSLLSHLQEIGDWLPAAERSEINFPAPISNLDPEGVQSPISTKIKVSYILGLGEDDDILAEAQRVFDQGVRVLKVKVGRDWAADLRRIRALQELFGAEMAIYADANECLAVDTAVSQLTQLAEMGVLYCEEPLPVELIQERAALHAGNHLPLIADDSTFSQRDLRRELALDTFDILNIKTARTGYSESARMLTAARKAGKSVMVGSQASAALGTARAGLFAALPGVNCPSELSFFLKLKEDIVQQRPCIRDGFLDVTRLADVEIDEDLLKEAEVGVVIG